MPAPIMNFLLDTSIGLLPALLAPIGLVLLARRTRSVVLLGLALLATSALLPLAFGYAISLGIAGAVLGGSAAAAWEGLRLGRLHRTLLTAAVLGLIAVPVLVIEAYQIQVDETYDRCAAEKALAIVDQSQIAGHANITDIAMQDGQYGDRPCYVSNGVNWLYSVGEPAAYTLGYWVDWRVTRRVCLHAARTQGWSCGFERWGPSSQGILRCGWTGYELQKISTTLERASPGRGPPAKA